MWSQGRFRDDGRDTDDMLAFAETVARLGFPAIEINYVIPPEGGGAPSNNHVDIVSSTRQRRALRRRAASCLMP
jgi:hypothetical protein